MSELLDQTAQVREGEELDVAKLEPYLRAELGLSGGEFAVEQFPAGHSNLTYLLRIGETEMVLRRPPFGSKVKSAHDMGREFRILDAIHEVYAPAPKPLLMCEDESVIGSPFYAMERLHGLILRNEKPEGLNLTPEIIRNTGVALSENLADLHSIDWKACGLESMRRDGAFVERQVDGWWKRYGGSKTDDIEHLEEVFKWCKDNVPPDVGAVLIHNDYKFDNIMLDPNDISRVVGVFDWEMSTIGDPLFDLGVSLSYWIDPDEGEGITTSRCFVNQEPGNISRREFAAIYGERMGLDVSNIDYYYVFALIKLAVVLQQIYYRYHEGLTKDERFASLIFGVKLLADRSAQVIDKGSM